MSRSHITAHLERVGSFLAMDVFAKAQTLEKQGRQILHLEFGEPDFPTPDIISKAAIQAINSAETKYTHTQGIEEFRQAVANKFDWKYNVSLSPDQVLTSNGSSVLLYLAIKLLVPPGDEILLTDLTYACYENLAIAAGVKAVSIPLRWEDNFQLDIDALKEAVTPRTKAILINSPMNPTGTVLSDDNLRELAKLGIPIISDEIYGDLIYEGNATSILNFTDNCIVLHGLSKYYAMTGWRLGYMILHPDWVPVAARVHQNMMISATHFVQKAGTVAINDAEDECRQMANAFNERRLFTLKRLKELNLDPGYNPTGAFYVFLKYPDQSKKSLDLSLDILDKVGVALTPGIDFGPGGEGFLRISYANSLERIGEAIDRLAGYFKRFG